MDNNLEPQMLIPDKRTEFENQESRGISFKTVYICSGILPKQIIFTKLEKLTPPYKPLSNMKKYVREFAPPKFTEEQIKSAKREHNRKYKEKNRERINAYKRKWAKNKRSKPLSN